MVTVMRPLPLPSIGMSEVLEGAWLVQLMVRVRPIACIAIVTGETRALRLAP